MRGAAFFRLMSGCFWLARASHRPVKSEPMSLPWTRRLHGQFALALVGLVCALCLGRGPASHAQALPDAAPTPVANLPVATPVSTIVTNQAKRIVYDDEEEDPATAKLPPDERAARRACTLCHLFVEPDMLTRENFRKEILPRMMVRLGIAKPDFAASPEGEVIRARKVYTERPLVPVEDWPLIEQFYLTHAPEQPVPQDPRPEITIGLPYFRAEPARCRFSPPSTTLIKISEKSHRIYLGDDKS